MGAQQVTAMPESDQKNAIKKTHRPPEALESDLVAELRELRQRAEAAIAAAKPARKATRR